MARFSQAIRLIRRASDGRPPGPMARGLRLSWRGRLLGIGLLLPGVAAVVAVPFLPASDRTGGSSTTTLTLIAGTLVVVLAFPLAIVHAFWTRSLRAVPESPSWFDADRRDPGGGVVAVVVGLVLAAASLAAAVLFGLLISHSAVELGPTLLFVVAAALHLGLTIARRRSR